jgi:hypothetical protein
MPSRLTVVLPGGLLDEDGVLHRTAVLRYLRGRDEEWLRELPAETTQARGVTEVLARVVVSIGPYRATREMIRGLTVGDRDYLAMKAGEMAFGGRVELVLTCEVCGEKMDADFDLDAVPVIERPQQAEYIVQLDGDALHFRLPRGADQEEVASVAALLDRCLVGESAGRPLSDAARAALDRELERVAPAVQASVEAVCPECGSTTAIRFDPGVVLFRELYRRQRHFEHGIHLLSFHYHWPLREILALTTPRRERYLRLLEGELAAV